MKTALHNERGVSLVLVALTIVILFGFAALTIDVGHIYHVKDQLQAGADAAALAGAGELTGDTDDEKIANAKAAAQRIAAKNFADTAAEVIPAFGAYSPGASPGEPIPIALNPALDIQVGHWDGASFTELAPPVPVATPLNAVRVFARRRAEAAYQPEVQNWFAGVFALLGGDFAVTRVEAAATAAYDKLAFLPIAVNEYWSEGECDAGGCPTGDPYNQSYPDSFMRQTNADGTPSTMVGRTFAIMGTEANGNNAGNINSFVNIFYRNRYHGGGDSTTVNGAWAWDPDQSPAQWVVRQDSTTGICSPTCANSLTALPAGITVGDVNRDKFDASFEMLFTGIPGNMIPPNAVREIVRPSPPFYGFDNYEHGPGSSQNDPSECPYATISYFSSSGSPPVNKKLNVENDDYDGTRFWERHPKGPDSKFMVMVYDGTQINNNFVTVVGYGIIQIDGYRNGPWNGSSPLGDRGGTAYGHAVPHGLAGADDPYLIQPSLNPPSARTPDCSFVDKLETVRRTHAQLRLVNDPDIRYGTAD